MKLIIDIEPRYCKDMDSDVKELYYEAINRITEAVRNGMPYEEKSPDYDEGFNAGYAEAIKNLPEYRELADKLQRPQGEFTDLEREVTADAINYLLGAELREANGYTEEVINALKSVLRKIGAEENHL